MTTHLEYYSQTQRAAQVEALRARHAEACGHALDDRARSDSGDPFQAQPHTVSAILTGDFNLRPEDPLHARMTAPFADPRVPAFADAWQFLHPGQRAAGDARRARLRPVARPVRVRLHLRDQRPVPAPAHRRGRRDDGGERPPAGARRARLAAGASCAGDRDERFSARSSRVGASDRAWRRAVACAARPRRGRAVARFDPVAARPGPNRIDSQDEHPPHSLDR